MEEVKERILDSLSRIDTKDLHCPWCYNKINLVCLHDHMVTCKRIYHSAFGLGKRKHRDDDVSEQAKRQRFTPIINGNENSLIMPSPTQFIPLPPQSRLGTPMPPFAPTMPPPPAPTSVMANPHYMEPSQS